MKPRSHLGLDRMPCPRCDHRKDMHVDGVCVVCDRWKGVCAFPQLPSIHSLAIVEY